MWLAGTFLRVWVGVPGDGVRAATGAALMCLGI